MHYPDEETVIKQITYRGHQIEVRIDKSDEPGFDRYTWCGSTDGSASNFYVITKLYNLETKKSSTLYLHRYLMKPPEGMLVDHINGITTDNRRSNLRIVTRAQNNANSRGRRTSSGRPASSKYKGVSRIEGKKRWRSKITHHGETFYLGTHRCEMEAARAYDRKAYELNGPYAFLNFPEDLSVLSPADRDIAIAV